MRQYQHDVYQERDRDRLDNTVWPLMSTNGVDLDDCKSYLLKRELSWTVAEANGWYPSRHAGDGFLRIVIPALSTKSEHVYWQARAVSSNVHIRYQSPSGPRHGALVRVLANPDADANDCSDEVVIVEGPMDALAVADCETDSIALMGIEPGDTAIQHLIKLVAKRPALIVLDNEPYAQSQASKLAMQLSSAGGKTHVAHLRAAKDLAAMKFSGRRAWLNSHLEDLL